MNSYKVTTPGDPTPRQKPLEYVPGLPEVLPESHFRSPLPSPAHSPPDFCRLCVILPISEALLVLRLGPSQANQEAVPICHLPAGVAVSGCCGDQLKPATLGADIPGSSGTSDLGGSVLHGVSQACSALCRGGQACPPSCLGEPAERRPGQWTVPAGGHLPRVVPPERGGRCAALKLLARQLAGSLSWPGRSKHRAREAGLLRLWLSVQLYLLRRLPQYFLGLTR